MVVQHFRQRNQQKRQAKLVPIDNLLTENFVERVNKNSKYIYLDLFETKYQLEDLLNKALGDCKNKRNKKIVFFSVILGMNTREISMLPDFALT